MLPPVSLFLILKCAPSSSIYLLASPNINLLPVAMVISVPFQVQSSTPPKAPPLLYWSCVLEPAGVPVGIPVTLKAGKLVVPLKAILPALYVPPVT